MEVFEKLKFFSINMPFECAEDAHLSSRCPTDHNEVETLKQHFPVTQAHLPNGRTIPLLKTMQTSVCEKDCNYCCFRSGRDTPRASLTPDELADAVVKLSNAKIAQGVFLSSGIAGSGIRTQDRIIATAELLRNKYGYKDYIHLKIMPGAEYDQIFRAMQLADRVSINLEGPGESYLRILSPHKNFLNELLELLRIVNTIRNNFPSHLGWNHHWPSSTTQFVVGAAGESDLDLLSMTENLTKNLKLSRSYFSRFTPVKNTPFENLPPLHALRQHRLYQASYLLRDYQFSLEDIQLGQDGNLSLEKDPKLTWAEHNLIERPIEINSAGYRELIKIPGVGPVIANKIIGIRKYGKIRDVQVLKKLGITIPRASRFILLDGYQPPFQEGLFYENP